MAYVCQLQALEQNHCDHKFPMLRIDELVDRMQGSVIYWTFNFTNAFVQIPTNPHDRYKTALHTSTLKPEYTCMPFGLVNAPAELQRQGIIIFQRISMRDGWYSTWMMYSPSVGLRRSTCSI